MSVALTGKDTTIILDRVFKDFGEGDVINIEFPDNLVDTKVGKNGNAIVSLKNSGLRSNVTLRVLAGSPDDKFLNSQLVAFKNDPPSYVLMPAAFVKRVGDGKGNVTNVTYDMNGGFIEKIPGAKDNTEGESEQGEAIYNLVFVNNDRILA